MRLDDLPESNNVEDRRGEAGCGGGGGGGFGLPIGGGGIGIGTVIVLGLIGWALGIDPSLLIGGAEQISRNSPSVEAAGAEGASGDRPARRATRWAASSAACWAAPKRSGRTSSPRKASTIARRCWCSTAAGPMPSAAASAQSAMGPFYCPADQKVYLDTSFFNEIATRFRGCDVGSKSCQFSQAYVIAHEVGHHVQNQLGILPKSQQLQRVAGSRAEANHIQVQVELQADCLAGVWANHENESLRRQGKPPFIEPGDIEAALRTAAAIGDDTLQKRAQGYVVPDSFTHGTSEQRQRWFTSGFKSGQVSSCNTFASAQL